VGGVGGGGGGVFGGWGGVICVVVGGGGGGLGVGGGGEGGVVGGVGGGGVGGGGGGGGGEMGCKWLGSAAAVAGMPVHHRAELGRGNWVEGSIMSECGACRRNRGRGLTIKARKHLPADVGELAIEAFAVEVEPQCVMVVRTALTRPDRC